MSRFFITAGAGLLGSNWARIKSQTSEVIVNTHRRKIDLPECTISNINLLNIDDIRIFLLKKNPDYVINTVALASVEECEIDPNRANIANVDVAKNLAIVCNQLSIKLVHISTDHLYSDSAPWSVETKKLSPCNNYGYTKMLSEIEVLRSCPDAIVVRTNFYGRGTCCRKSFSDIIIEIIQNQKKIQLFNDVFYTPIAIDSLIRLIDRLLEINFSGVINVAGLERLSKYEFGVRLAHFFGLNSDLIEPISILQRHDLVVRPREMSLSTDLLQSVTGCKPPNIMEDFGIISPYYC